MRLAATTFPYCCNSNGRYDKEINTEMQNSTSLAIAGAKKKYELYICIKKQ